MDPAAGRRRGADGAADEAGRPSLLERSADGRLRLHTPVDAGDAGADAGWAAVDLGASSPLAAAPVVVDGAVVLPLRGEDGTLRPEALLPGSENPRVPLLPAAAAAAAEPADGLFGVLSAGGRLWLASDAPAPPAAEAGAGGTPAWAAFAAEPRAERGLKLTPIELDGSRGVDRRLGVTDRSRPAGVADFPLLLLVLMVATAATFIFWRRDPKRQQLRLGESQRLATVSARLAAAAIDAAPGFLGAWLLFSAEPAAVLAHWPGLGRPSLLVEVVPPLFLVAVTVLHTGLSEALTGRSLGKALLRLRVSDLGGRRVSAKRASSACC